MICFYIKKIIDNKNLKFHLKLFKINKGNDIPFIFNI